MCMLDLKKKKNLSESPNHEAPVLESYALYPALHVLHMGACGEERNLRVFTF